MGALGLVGRGFGPAGRAGLGWAWGLAVLGFGRAGRAGWVGRVGRAGRAGWVGRGVGRGVWPCWARWAGVGVGLAMVGALTGLGVVFKVEKYTIEVQSRLSKCNTLKVHKYTLEVQK